MWTHKLPHTTRTYLCDEVCVVLLLDDLLALLGVIHACADDKGNVDRVLDLANLIHLQGRAHVKVGVAAVAVQALLDQPAGQHIAARSSNGAGEGGV